MIKKTVIYQLIEKNIISDSSTSTTNSDWSDLSSSSVEESIDSSSDEETEDFLFFPLMQYLTAKRRRHRVLNYLEVVDSWTEPEFKSHMRLERQTALQLIGELERSGVIPTHVYGVKPISAKLSFFIFLWYMANTEPLRTMSDRFNVSISSVFRVIRRMMNWLLTKLDDTIRWPQGHNVHRVCEQFSHKRGIKNIIGAIDCTHIRIEKPMINARDYCNRKKYFSINLQAVVDSNMRFTNVYCGEPGSLHDARVLRRSPLYQMANEDKEALFPNETFIIGDSAYGSLTWLVPPFRDNGHLTPQQAEFNFLHSSTRMSVERAFGHLKGRFRRIKFFNEYREMSFITNTVMAACILHNYCINENDNYNFEDECVDDCVNINNDQNVYMNWGAQVDRRMRLFIEMFPEN